MKNTIEEILKDLIDQSDKNREASFINDDIIRARIDYICKCASNRAGVRLLMSCMFAKIDNPDIDPRKPYTEIGSKDSFSGRTYDERYLSILINKYNLPCNPTTAFLTPTLRNINKALMPNIELIGRPRELYIETLKLLDDIANNKLAASTVFLEILRNLLNIRDEKKSRMTSLLDEIKSIEGSLPLSSEAIVKLIEQHIACKNSSRLPVLIVAAAYKTAQENLAEKFLPLRSHNAADLQTGAIGDIEICLFDNDHVVTVYEMKMKRVSIHDIDSALIKISRSQDKPQNYIFISTDIIEPAVLDYANKIYENSGGIEVAILDCLSFLRYFLHLFHRLRIDFLDNYQDLILSEPDSAVNQTLKEAFLILRKAAESIE